MRTRYSHTIATRCRVKRAIHRGVVDKVRGRTDGPSQVAAGGAAPDPRSTEDVGGSEDRSLFGGRPRRWPAAPRWESERPRSIGATDRPTHGDRLASRTHWLLSGATPRITTHATLSLSRGGRVSARQQQQFSPAPSVTAAPPSLYCLSEGATRRRSPSTERPSLPRPPVPSSRTAFFPSVFVRRSLVPPSADGRGFCAPAVSPIPIHFPLLARSLSLPWPLPPSRTSALYTKKRARRGTFLSIYFHLLFICPSLFLFSLSMPLRVLQRGIAGC